MEFLHLLTILGNAAEESPQGIAALGIDPLALIAQAVTFLLLFFIIKKYALGKIVDTLEKRRKTIDDGVRLGLEMEAEKTKLEERIEASMQKAREQADKIIAQAHEEAGAIVEKAEEDAVAKVDVMIKDAGVKIEGEVKRAKQVLKQETIELVADATEAIIKQKLDAKKDASLIEQALRGEK